jgi:hypothetical protein
MIVITEALMQFQVVAHAGYRPRNEVKKIKAS